MILSKTKVNVVDHPLAKRALTVLRDFQTNCDEFRHTSLKLSGYLIYEAMRQLETREIGLETPVGRGLGVAMTDYTIVAPVLRAGMIMSEVAQQMLPDLKIYHIGLKRDEKTLEAHSYYVKLPDSLPPDCRVFILDPMLATGGSAVAAISLFNKLGVSKIHLVSFLAAPEGIKNVHDNFPDVIITTAAIDDHLNEHGYIVPGLGDAGDRIFGT